MALGVLIRLGFRQHREHRCESMLLVLGLLGFGLLGFEVCVLGARVLHVGPPAGLHAGLCLVLPEGVYSIEHNVLPMPETHFLSETRCLGSDRRGWIREKGKG